jgi:hypothetical protein
VSSFLSSFDGHWRRPSDDYKKAVNDYRISVDTNVLLELYRFTPTAREELLVVLRHVRNRLWIPHQVAREYYGRRVSAIKEHLALYESVPDALEEQKKKAIQELHAFAKRCSIGIKEKQLLIDPIERAFQQVNAEIAKHRNSFDLTLERVIDSDPVLMALAEILDGRMGAEFGEPETSRHLAESQRRAAEKIPPGYKDAGKGENPHGDYFLWEQLLVEHAKDSKPLLFVTNDSKEDWVRKEAGLIVGARPELVAEFDERCKSDFLIMQLGRFLQMAKEELGVTISESTVAQAENSDRNPPAAPKETVTLPKAHYLELALALHNASRAIVRDLGHLSVNERRAELNKARKARNILNNIKNSAAQKGDDVEFCLPLGDWESAFLIWRTQGTIGTTESEEAPNSIPEVRHLNDRIQYLENERDALWSESGGNSELEEIKHIEVQIDELRQRRQTFAPIRRDRNSSDHLEW